MATIDTTIDLSTETFMSVAHDDSTQPWSSRTGGPSPAST